VTCAQLAPTSAGSLIEVGRMTAPRERFGDASRENGILTRVRKEDTGLGGFGLASVRSGLDLVAQFQARAIDQETIDRT
jgi:hypothetical protein